MQDAFRRLFAYVINGIYPLLRTFWQSLVHEICSYVFVENQAIISWAISKRSTNTELETDISRNVHFQQYDT